MISLDKMYETRDGRKVQIESNSNAYGAGGYIIYDSGRLFTSWDIRGNFLSPLTSHSNDLIEIKGNF